MTDGLFILLCAVAVVGTSVIWIQARRIRQLQRKIDVHTEALRMLAQPIHVELPPEPPTKPDLKLLKGGMVAFSAATSTGLGYLHRHAGAAGTIAAGTVASALALVLIVTNLGRRAPAALRPPSPPLASQSTGAPASPSAARSVPVSSPPPPAVLPTSVVAPAAVTRRPSSLHRSSPPPTQSTTATASPGRSPTTPSPSASQPSPCPVGLTLRLDPVLRIEVCV